MQPFMEISRFNLKWKGYLCNLCYWVYLVKFIQTAWKVGWHLFCMQFQWNLVQIPRKYIVLSHISSRHMNLKKKKVSGVIFFAICSADGPCFVLLPLRIDRVFEEILFLVEEVLLLLKYWNTISADKRSFIQLLVPMYPSAISLNTKQSRKLKNKRNGCERKENI